MPEDVDLCYMRTASHGTKSIPIIYIIFVEHFTHPSCLEFCLQPSQ
jgi:hypothetical protein